MCGCRALSSLTRPQLSRKTFVFHVKYHASGAPPEWVRQEEHVAASLAGRGLEETEDSQVVASSQGAMTEGDIYISGRECVLGRWLKKERPRRT